MLYLPLPHSFSNFARVTLGDRQTKYVKRTHRPNCAELRRRFDEVGVLTEGVANLYRNCIEIPSNVAESRRRYDELSGSNVADTLSIVAGSLTTT